MKLTAQTIELEDIRRTFEEAERRFPVDRWMVGSLHVWPIVRNDLYLKMFCGYFPQGASPAAPAVDTGKRGLRLLGRLFRAFRDITRPSGFLLAHRFPVKGAQALLLSDGLSFTTIAGNAFEKFCDPVGLALAAKGRSAILMNPSPDGRKSSATNTVSIRDLLDSSRMRSLLHCAVKHVVMEVDLDGYSEFSDWVRRRHALQVLSESELRIIVQTIESYANVFERVLNRTGAKIGFLCSYYCNEGYAFALACRRKRVLAVDIQHGVGDDVHMAYVGWERVPDVGYELIPSAFWCWSENDVAGLTRWTHRHARYHRAILGANLLLESYRSGRIGGSPGEQLQLNELVATSTFREGAPLRAIALVSLQPNYISDPEWRGRLHRLMALTGDDVTWWMRLHPGMMNSLDVAKSLAPLGLRVEFRVSSSLPLYLLLQHTNVHLTHCSSTVIEASAFGMHSLLLSQLGADYFSTAILDGYATHVRGDGEFLMAFGCAVTSRLTSGIAQVEAGKRLDRAHQTLVELVDAGPT